MAETIIPDNVGRAIKEFCELLRGELGANLLGIRLFGSVVRGTATPESDIDILVLVQREDRATREAIIGATVGMNLKHDVVISPVIMSAERYSAPLFRETHFYKSLQEEGIPL
ncbi:MAG: nucleotidyltransferase domain-containing protein [Moorellaceae bacterium]